MKSIFIAFFSSFLMLADLNGQWEIVRDSIYGTGRKSRDVCFINKQTGFIVENFTFHKGYYGYVIWTNDGGKSWNKLYSVNSVYLNKCIFPNDLIGFVTCISSGFYQTSDGGINWIKIQNGLTSIKDLFFVNEQLGFAAADTSIYKTSNTGESWERISFYEGLHSIFFIDDSTGWAVGESGLILKLTDKGSSEKIASGTTLPLNKVFFADRNTGWIAGGYNNTDGLFPVLLKTIDGGESWSKIDNIIWLIRDFYFLNDQEGWAVGDDNNMKGILIETNDGGNNWSVQVGPLRVPLTATDFKDGYGWAIGNGLVLKKDFSVITGIKEKDEMYHNNPILLQNYPNPFSSTTTIKYQLPAISNIDISVYSITGIKVKTLVKDRQQAGRYEVECNTGGMTPGIYFCELKAGNNKQVRKMIVLK